MEKKVSQVMKLLLQDKIKNNSGFTMIELLLSSLLIAVIVTLITMSYFNTTRSSEVTISIATSAQDARTAMNLITKDIREISEITYANGDEFIFKSNIDSDEADEELHYQVIADTDEGYEGFYKITRAVDNGSAKVVARHLLGGQIFSYTSGYGQEPLEVPVEAGLLVDIRNVSIGLSIDQQETVEGPRTMNLETSVTLRNRV
ncbi:MAG: prepilin-type N-terminal cleavage/methylation domain-containing protein [Actinomycetota bacterium]|nr:prepilin-type N-terminal cleavage/methylation domain-containing protein [Actinomycetota bacterium]